MPVFLFLIGLVSILGQVVLLRELNVAFFGVELIYLLAIGVWLFWTAVGAAIGRGSHLPSANGVRTLFLLFGLVLPLDVVFIRCIRVIFSGVPGAYLPFAQQILGMVAALLPVGLLLGLLFQWAAKRYVTGDKTLALAYAVESAGGLLGGLTATGLLMLGVRNLTVSALCGILAAGGALAGGGGRRSRGVRFAGTCLIGLLLILLWQGPRLDQRLTGVNHRSLVGARDTPYSRVTVTETEGLVSVFENDALAFESEGTGAEEFVHLAALQHPDPDRVLILGGGVEGLVSEMLRHEPQRIDDVELNAPMLEMVLPHLPEDIRDALTVRGVGLHIADPRRFLETGPTYDLILVGMPEPTSGQANRFYTQEFFAQCAGRLGPAGILALRLRAAENLWTPQLTRRTASITRALRSAFADVVVLPGVTNIVIASPSPLVRDPKILADRLAARGIDARLVTARYLDYLYTNDRFSQIAGLLAATDVPANSDARPICYQFAIMIWLSQFFPALARPDPASLGGGTGAAVARWILLLAVPGIFVVSRKWLALRRVLLVAVAGFIGMVLESLLVLNYQVKSGILYQDIGLLLTLFMTGLAVGALAADKLAVRRARAWQVTRWLGAGLLLGFALLGALAGLWLRAGSLSGLAATGLLLALGGFFVSGLFAYVSLRDNRDQRDVISPLYAADLIGGCAGSLAGSLVLLPLIGLPTSAALMVFLAAAALLLL